MRTLLESLHPIYEKIRQAIFSLSGMVQLKDSGCKMQRNFGRVDTDVEAKVMANNRTMFLLY